MRNRRPRSAPDLYLKYANIQASVCSMVDEEAQEVWPSCLGKRNLNHGFDIVFCVYYNVGSTLLFLLIFSAGIGRSTVKVQQVI